MCVTHNHEHTHAHAHAVPDLSHIDEKLVHLLALQRIQQLFIHRSQSSNTNHRSSTEIPLSIENSTQQQQSGSEKQHTSVLNGLKQPLEYVSPAKHQPKPTLNQGMVYVCVCLIQC